MPVLFQIRPRLIILFPRSQVFSLGIRLTTLTIPQSANSFKREAFSFLSVFSARHYFGIWVFSISQIMCLHTPTKKRLLVIFRSLKNVHVLAFWRLFLRINPGRYPPLTTDAYVANRKWGFLMPMLPCANIGGLKRDGLSTDTILGYYYSQLTASVSHLISP